ncbi:MAG TPA: Gmad2 immunoglobulin-like domain-containing protein [Nocardioides sp.]|nr:Gmad2 immunoglobulin-like domain-containing protein [Nocardioides sp.]
MSNDTIGGLLREVADSVEPTDRLDAIRAATAHGGRRRSRGWWAAGGVGLVAASVVTAVALTTGGGPRVAETGPADESTATSTATEPNPATSRVVPVYFVGDTPSGPRLYREFQRGTGPMSAETFALDAALRGDAIDPDYRSLWPADASAGPYLMSEDLIQVDVMGDLHDRPSGMSEAEAQLAVEQLVRTAQGVFGHGRIPVQITLNNARTDQVLGVPTSEPLSAGSDLDVLAHVSISNPSEGQEVDNDRPLTVKGVGNSFEGNVVTRIQRWDDTYVVDELPTIAGSYEDRLFPYEVTFDLTEVAPGDYVVISRTDDPSGAGMFHTDTRRITVVD